MLKGKKVLAVVALMLVMVMVFVACAPAVQEEVVETWTSDAGTEYNLVAKEDIVIGFNNGSITVDFLRMVGENTVEVAEREGIKIVTTESNFDAELIFVFKNDLREDTTVRPYNHETKKWTTVSGLWTGEDRSKTVHVRMGS